MRWVTWGVLGAVSPSLVVVCMALAGCATVRSEDLRAWEGVPIAELDKHPLFLTMSVVRTVAADGTEIRNYVNGREVASCGSGGAVFRGSVSMATFNTFTNCTSTFSACNNIFYINNGRVTRYAPTASGNARCFTDERVRPGA